MQSWSILALALSGAHAVDHEIATAGGVLAPLTHSGQRSRSEPACGGRERTRSGAESSGVDASACRVAWRGVT